MYADMGVNLSKAQAMIRKALEGRRLELAYQDSMAWVLYKQGKFREAAEMFDQIVLRSREEESQHPVMFDHAGDAFYRLGWTDRAAALWQEAVELSKKEQRSSVEIKLIREQTPGKIQAARGGKPAAVAPLGLFDKGVESPQTQKSKAN